MGDSRQRLAAIDWMRGWVMVLMTVDHASMMFNAGRVANDSVAAHPPGAVLPTDQFLLRWVTHLCAPTFVFLAGTGLALSAARREAGAAPQRAFDRDMAIRGLIIMAYDLLLFSNLAPFRLFQVMYAIGLGMLCMIPLRRLSDRWLLGLALGWFAVGEALTSLVWRGSPTSPLIWALTLSRHVDDEVHAIYPLVPWLSMMMVGWVFGRHLVRRQQRAAGPPLGLLLASGSASKTNPVAVSWTPVSS